MQKQCGLYTIITQRLSSFCLGDYLALLFLAFSWTGVAFAGPVVQTKTGSAMNADGRSFTMRIPGMTDCQSQFSATVMIGGETQVLASTAGKVYLLPGHVSEATPYGLAQVTVVEVHFEKEKVDLLFRLGYMPGVPGMLAQAGIKNTGKEPINLVSVTPAVMTGNVLGNPADWLVTSLTPSANHSKAVFKMAELREPLHVEEGGGFYRRDKVGFLFGPVGEPIAFLYTTLASDAARFSLRIEADMSGVRVEAGETRWGQQAALLTSPPHQALTCWAAWVAKTHGARTDKGALSGWNSWYFLGKEVTGKDVLDVVSEVLKSPNRFRPSVIQIGRGYKDTSNKEDINEKFPEGLAFYAQRIAATGARPGLTVPDIKPSSPGDGDGDVSDEILHQCRQAVKDGFTYLKFDVNYSSTPFACGPVTTRKTSFEQLRESYSKIRSTVGPDTYLMCFDSWPNRAEVGFVDASRTGHAASRLGVRRAMDHALASYHLSGRWFYVDNHGYYMGTDVANVSQIAGGWPLVRTWMSMVGLSGGSAITSDPWHWEDFKPYWRNVEVLNPPTQERVEVLDLCTDMEWPRLVSHVCRDWGDMTVALLWNTASTERTVTLDFEKAGLDPRRRYAVWSFWDNRYLGVTKGTWSTPALPPSGSQHLCFTDLDQTPDRPVLIGSSLHITCGATEIKRVTCGRSALEIELTDAGAREGDLFVYSRHPLVWQGAHGCSVPSIISAGEYVWRVSIAERQRGRPQRVTLERLIPVTHQIWFWVLIASVVASLLFTAWRYQANLRLRREHVLEQERTRIARDLHDDLGAGLTEITMLSDVARLDSEKPEAIRAHLGHIFQKGSEMAQALDEIVWAVNPDNDTLEKLISFTCEFAQAILEAAGIRCRLDVPARVPNLSLNSKTRHQLCMALKECLNNVVKHAHAHEVCVCIRQSGQLLDVTVKDDGEGFDPSILTNRAGTHDGLFNLSRRMADIGGTCEITSTLGQGTRVTLRVRI